MPGTRTLGSVGKLRRRPESEQFFRLTKTATQAMFVLSAIQPDAGRRKKGRSKPDRVFRRSLVAIISLAAFLAAPSVFAKEGKPVTTLKGEIKGDSVDLTLSLDTSNATNGTLILVQGDITYKNASFPDHATLLTKKGLHTIDLRQEAISSDTDTHTVKFTFSPKSRLDEEGWRSTRFTIPAGISELSVVCDCGVHNVDVPEARSIKRISEKHEEDEVIAAFDSAREIMIRWKAEDTGLDYLAMVFNLIGGLSIFLLGMKNMSEGMQAIAGSRLRRMIGVATNNRLLACGTGAMVTSIIQSSSVTTVMLVGFVNAGLMTLLQAIGVILGADIGTTITGWIVSLNVAKYGLPVLGIAGFFFLFTKNERLRYLAMTFMGVGMVFFGLQLMKHGLEPLRHSENFIAWFSRFEPTSYFGVLKCVLAGAVVTAVVQSSSATVAITMTLAATGVIRFDTAVALVLGENIGTTITAFLASIGASTNAKRVAYVHILIKTLGVCIMVVFFFRYMQLLRTLLPDDTEIKKQIAFSHTLFNIFLVCFFLPLRNPLAALLMWLVPGKPHKETPQLTFLNVRLLDTPAFGIQQSSEEIVRMSDGVHKMMEWLKSAIAHDSEDTERDKHIFHREEVLDIMQKEIVEFLGHVLSGNVPQETMLEARSQLRIADEYESISDYITAILKLRLKWKNLDMAMSKEERRRLLELHALVHEYLTMITQAVKENNSGILSKATTQGTAITHLMKEHRETHIAQIEGKHVSPLNSLLFVDMLTSYRRIKDHALNIAETVAGEK